MLHTVCMMTYELQLAQLEFEIVCDGLDLTPVVVLS